MSCSSAPQTARSRSMPSKSAAAALDELRDLDRVLEQAAAVGVVVVLGGGRLAVGAAARRGRVEQPGDQPGQVRVLDGGDQARRGRRTARRSGAPGRRAGPPTGRRRPAGGGASRSSAAGRSAGARRSGRLTWTASPGSSVGASSASHRTAGTLPERSASMSRRYGASSRLRRRSVSRTSRTRSTGQASVRSRTSGVSGAWEVVVAVEVSKM